MQRLDIKFLLLGAVMLIGGVGMGIYMGIAHDFALSPIHAHTNLVGFVSLSLFGIVYRLYPELQERRAAKVHFALAAPAAIAFPFGIYLAIFAQNPILSIVASLAWMAGCLLFLAQLASLAFGGSREPALAPAE
jgi:cbb3-type cytochrome oxidase subunit 1